MTRSEVIEKYRHEIGGIAIEALMIGLQGSPSQNVRIAEFIRTLFRRIDERLGQAWADSQPVKPEPKPAPPVNGAHLPNKQGAKP